VPVATSTIDVIVPSGASVTTVWSDRNVLPSAACGPESTRACGVAPPAGTPSTGSGPALNANVEVPSPARACCAAAISASSSISRAAYVARASRCTQPIDEPGRMSWNWCSSTVRHAARNSS
jgi:hypothetical protein